MIKNLKKMILSSVIILLPVLFGLAVWEQLPEQIATHWGPNGQPDGWSSKASAVFFMPLVLVVIHWICTFATGKDQKNEGQNKKLMKMTDWLVPLISLLVNGMVYATALGSSFSPMLVLPLVMGVMFIFIGNYMPKCKPNRTIGLRVKWTLENEENWKATHRFGGKVLFFGGVFLLFGVFLPEAVAMWVILPVMLVIVAVPIVYSYRYSKKHS